MGVTWTRVVVEEMREMDRFERHLEGKLKRTLTGVSDGHLDEWWFHLLYQDRQIW